MTSGRLKISAELKMFASRFLISSSGSLCFGQNVVTQCSTREKGAISQISPVVILTDGAAIRFFFKCWSMGFSVGLKHEVGNPEDIGWFARTRDQLRLFSSLIRKSKVSYWLHCASSPVLLLLFWWWFTHFTFSHSGTQNTFPSLTLWGLDHPIVFILLFEHLYVEPPVVLKAEPDGEGP